MNDMWLIVNGVGLIVLLVVIVLASLSAANRGFIPGLLLISAAVVGTTLMQLRLVRPEWMPAARSLCLVVGIVGLALVERVRVALRSSGGRPS